MNGQASLKLPEILSDMNPHSKSCTISLWKRGTSVAALTSAILAPHDFVAISSPECTSVNILNHPLMIG